MPEYSLRKFIRLPKSFWILSTSSLDDLAAGSRGQSVAPVFNQIDLVPLVLHFGCNSSDPTMANVWHNRWNANARSKPTAREKAINTDLWTHDEEGWYGAAWEAGLEDPQAEWRGWSKPSDI